MVCSDLATDVKGDNLEPHYLGKIQLHIIKNVKGYQNQYETLRKYEYIEGKRKRTFLKYLEFTFIINTKITVNPFSKNSFIDGQLRKHAT